MADSAGPGIDPLITVIGSGIFAVMSSVIGVIGGYWVTRAKGKADQAQTLRILADALAQRDRDVTQRDRDVSRLEGLLAQSEPPPPPARRRRRTT